MGGVEVLEGCFEGGATAVFPPEDGNDGDVGKLIKVHCGRVPTPHKLPLPGGVLIWHKLNRTESYSYDQGGLGDTMYSVQLFKVLHQHSTFHHLSLGVSTPIIILPAKK